MPLRVRLAWDTTLRNAVLKVMIRAIFAWLRARGKERGVVGGKCGAVSLTQNFGGSFNLNIHFHVMVLDGVFDADGRFCATGSPSTSDVQDLVDTIRSRVERMLVKRGVVDEEPEDGQRVLFATSAQGMCSEGRRPGRWRGASERPGRTLPKRCAQSGWYNLHAGVTANGHDRAALERLCRYVARPAVSRERLSIKDGRVVLRLKSPWDDGTTDLFFTPEAFAERMAALVAVPRVHGIQYFGVLAPAAKDRARVVADAGPAPGKPKKAPGRIPWAELLDRVFAIDVMRCERCGGQAFVRSFVVINAGPVVWPRAGPGLLFGEDVA